jgi:hypothetical protein
VSALEAILSLAMQARVDDRDEVVAFEREVVAFEREATLSKAQSSMAKTAPSVMQTNAGAAELLTGLSIADKGNGRFALGHRPIKGILNFEAV